MGLTMQNGGLTIRNKGLKTNGKMDLNSAVTKKGLTGQNLRPRGPQIFVSFSLLLVLTSSLLSMGIPGS
jgi:hypothetical protein